MLTIAMLTRWNATCGVSVHAELIGREFVRMGHRLIVFAPTLQSAGRWWHHKVVRKDERWVIRCYDELEPTKTRGGKIDLDVILSKRFDVLVVESYRSIPYDDVEKVVRRVKAKTVMVVHNSGLDDPLKLPIDIFDAIVVFDERYVREVVGWGRGRVRIIPFPCHPVRPGRRKKPPFAKGKFLFFSFGRQPDHEYASYLAALSQLSKTYDLAYWIARSGELLPVSEPWIVQESKKLELNELYDRLHMADVHLLPKGFTQGVVVSSTLYLCLGSLCPTVVPDTRHFETLPSGGESPVVKYRDVEDLRRELVRLIEDEDYRRRIISAAEKYVAENSSEIITRKFLDLFYELLDWSPSRGDRL